MSGFRGLVRRLLQYEVYRIYARDASSQISDHRVDVEVVTDPAIFAASLDQGIRELAEYAGPDAFGLCARLEGVVVGGCWLWFGERYLRERGFVSLAADEAKLVQVTVAEQHRGHGVAPALVAAAVAAAAERGFRRVLARIWHSHAASIRAFDKAGWRYQYTVVVIRPIGLGKPIRYRFFRPARSVPG